MKLVTKFLVVVLGLLVAAYVVPGIIVENLYAAFIAALILGVLNLTVRPILFVLTLPITILTLGLFAFVLNGLLLWFVASFMEGVTVDGFLSALLGALIISVISWAGDRVLKD